MNIIIINVINDVSFSVPLYRKYHIKTTNNLSRLSYGNNSDNLEVLRICNCMNVLIVQTITINRINSKYL